MDKNEILKRNLLKRLYGEEKTTAELSGSSDEETTSCNSATKPKIYGAAPAPIGYKNVKQFVEHSQDKTNDNDHSSDGGDKYNTHSHGKRRRRRHRKNESETTDKSLEKDTESSGHQVLTKNQKRKLKKKRRKEKQKQNTTSVPFSYVNINEAELKAGCTGVKKLGDSPPQIRGDQVKDVIEFVDAVWDLYKQEGIIKNTLSDHHDEKWNNLLSWIQGLEKSMDKDEVLHDKIKCICDIKTSLILNNKCKAMEEMKTLQDLTNDKDDTELVSFFCELMEYWMTNVMPGS